jgi:isopentenyl-diphosphate delta-isomerase
MQDIILVDENDKEVGFEEKLKAHQNGGKLHRAFSVFVFNSDGKLLLQQRANGKYHSELLWTNTCCGHPRPGEDIEAAARRRLKEEIGFSCDLKKEFNFIYKIDFENGLSEKEFDHVFSGKFNDEPKPDPNEAAGWKWVKIEELKKHIKENPEKYTHWFKICFDKVLKYM